VYEGWRSAKNLVKFKFEIEIEIEIEIGIEIGIDSCSDWHLALMERSNFAAKLQQAPLTSILFPRP
jgi:hypothetical protein